MRVFLVEFNQEVYKACELLRFERQYFLGLHYQNILKADEKESPTPIPLEGKRGRPKEPNHVTYLSDYKTMKVMHSDS